MLTMGVVVTVRRVHGFVSVPSAGAAAAAVRHSGSCSSSLVQFQQQREGSMISASTAPSQLSSVYSFSSSTALSMADTNTIAAITTTATEHVLIPRIRLKRNRQTKHFRDGSQLIFSGSILANTNTPNTLKMGDLVQVEVPSSDPKSPTNTIIGWGLYNPNSLYRIRVLVHNLLLSPRTKTELFDTLRNDDDEKNSNIKDKDRILQNILVRNFHKAIQTRRALGLDCVSEEESEGRTKTDTYRLVNGEGDVLSGLAVDIVGGNIAVIMSSASWCEIHKDTIQAALHTVLNNHNKEQQQQQQQQNRYEFVWKTTPSRLKQDGYYDENEDDNNNGNVNTKEGEQDEGQNNKPVLCYENGIQYRTYPHNKVGQKTSVYCDQRDNRWDLAALCRRHQTANTAAAQPFRVLDLCCYHGGFALNAMINGQATLAVGVDSSHDAIDACKTNAKLNNLALIEDDNNNDTTTVATEGIQFVKSDIDKYMKQCYDDNEKTNTNLFDVIVLDPPKLAPSMKGLQRASRKYHSLNRDAIKLINEVEGGIFMSCTCSAAMTQHEGGTYFLNMISQAAISAQRELTLLKVSGAASCHTQSPSSFPAGKYLTAATFRVHPKK